MAIPFAIPDEENEIAVIMHQLQLIIVRLHQVMLRRDAERNLSAQNTSRVYTNSSHHHGNNSVNNNIINPQTTNSLPDIVNNLAWLTSSNRHNTVGQLTTASSVSRIPRRRTNSESSYCEESKAVQSQNLSSQDWIQVGLIPRKIADDFQILEINKDEDSPNPESKTGSKESLFSKLVPDCLSNSLWTAVPVICVVGWHLLRPR